MAGSIVINRKMRRNCLAVASTRGLQRAPTGHQEINWCACQISNNLLCGLRVMPVPLTLISPQIHYCPFLPFFFFFDVSNTRSPFLSALSGCTRTETRRPTSEFGNTHYACLYTHAKHTHTL